VQPDKLLSLSSPYSISVRRLCVLPSWTERSGQHLKNIHDPRFYRLFDHRIHTVSPNKSYHELKDVPPYTNGSVECGVLGVESKLAINGILIGDLMP
jgi:hypothetical protein